MCLRLIILTSNLEEGAELRGIGRASIKNSQGGKWCEMLGGEALYVHKKVRYPVIGNLEVSAMQKLQGFCMADTSGVPCKKP